MPNFSFLSGSNILVRGGVGWLYTDYNASLSSNWTELDWTGTELGKISFRLGPIFDIIFKKYISFIKALAITLKKSVCLPILVGGTLPN